MFQATETLKHHAINLLKILFLLTLNLCFTKICTMTALSPALTPCTKDFPVVEKQVVDVIIFDNHSYKSSSIEILILFNKKKMYEKVRNLGCLAST